MNFLERDRYGHPIPHISGHKIPADPKKSLTAPLKKFEHVPSKNKMFVAPPKISSKCYKDLVHQTMNQMSEVLTLVQTRVSKLWTGDISLLVTDLEERKNEIEICERERPEHRGQKSLNPMVDSMPPARRMCEDRDFEELRSSTEERLESMYVQRVAPEIKDLENLVPAFVQLYDDCNDAAYGRNNPNPIPQRYQYDRSKKIP